MKIKCPYQNTETASLCVTAKDHFHIWLKCKACYATINQLEIKREVILLKTAFCIINFRDAHVACVAIHYLHINSDFNSARCDLTLG